MRSGEGLDVHVAVRLAPEDHGALRLIAERRGETLSELIQEAQRIVVEADRQERRAHEANPFVPLARARQRSLARGPVAVGETAPLRRPARRE